MNARFFALRNKLLKSVVIIKRKRNGDLVVAVFLKIMPELLDLAYYFNSVIARSNGYKIIENSRDNIAPLRIIQNPADITFRSP